MKNLSLILSGLALAATGGMYYLHFTHTEQLKKQIITQNSHRDTGNFRIAYFDVDSLQANFKIFKEAEVKVKSKETQKNAELNDYSTRYQKRLKELQEKAPAMTQSEGEAAQRELAQMQERFQKREFELDQELKKLQMDLMGDLRKKIEDYLKKYNSDKGYAFVFSYDPGFMMYYKDTLYDITKDLITGLNKEYPVTKKN